MKPRSAHMGTGMISLVMMFSVLCLVIFALLTLTTALNQRALSSRTAQSTQAYYDAQARCAAVAAVLARGGELPGQVDGLEVTYTPDPEGTRAAFSCPVDENRALEVELLLTGGEMRVLRWQSQRTQQWQADQDLPVWQGD